jgi:hypothetical protein
MRGYRVLRGIKIVVMIVLAVIVFGYIVMHLWNWLMPSIFGLREITFAQSLGILLLSKILLGGFHRHGHHGGGWKRHMEERFAHMSPEERERFRAGMRGRRWCSPRTPAEQPSEPTSI